MKKKRIIVLLVLVFFGATIFACADKAADSSSENVVDEAGDSEKGVIEQFNSKNAQKAVKAIRTPINKARKVKTRGENKMNNMDEMVNQ